RHSSEICAYNLSRSCSSPIQNPLRPVDERNGTLKFGSRYLECRSLNFWVTKNAVLGHSIDMKILDGIVRPRHMLEYQCRNFCPLLHATLRSLTTIFSSYRISQQPAPMRAGQSTASERSPQSRFLEAKLKRRLRFVS